MPTWPAPAGPSGGSADAEETITAPTPAPARSTITNTPAATYSPPTPPAEACARNPVPSRRGRGCETRAYVSFAISLQIPDPGAKALQPAEWGSATRPRCNRAAVPGLPNLVWKSTLRPRACDDSRYRVIAPERPLETSRAYLSSAGRDPGVSGGPVLRRRPRLDLLVESSTRAGEPPLEGDLLARPRRSRSAPPSLPPPAPRYQPSIPWWLPRAASREEARRPRPRPSPTDRGFGEHLFRA